MEGRTIIEIVEKAIREGGYDGLYNVFEGCACTLKKGLQPCGVFHSECTMGYEIPGTGEFEGTFEVVKDNPRRKPYTPTNLMGI